MKSASKTLTVNLAIIGLLAVQTHPAFAQITLTGIVPAGSAQRKGVVVVLPQNSRSGATGMLKFKFSVPARSPINGLSYSLGFCVSPPANPCGGSTDLYTVAVNEGEERLAVFDASIFATNVLAVATPGNIPLRFTVTME